MAVFRFLNRQTVGSHFVCLMGSLATVFRTADGPTRHVRVLLEESAIRDRGGAAWIGASPLPDGNRSQLGVVGSDLYSGRAGVALFLAALYRVTGAAASRDLSIEALRPLRHGSTIRSALLGR